MKTGTIVSQKSQQSQKQLSRQPSVAALVPIVGKPPPPTIKGRVRIWQPTEPKPPPPGFGFELPKPILTTMPTRKEKKKVKGKQRPEFYTPSLTGAMFIRPSRKAPRGPLRGLFSGIEIRPAVKRGGRR